VAEELEKEKRFTYEIVAKLDELGLMGVPYPEEYGGGGADTLSYALVIEELARFPIDPRAARYRSHGKGHSRCPPGGCRSASIRLARLSAPAPSDRRRLSKAWIGAITSVLRPASSEVMTLL
jgi:hypothetical protein